ncbi:MAG: hypothetical protein FVQ82_02495 [Planctomycetes bacterium]|nr:hypothetical protein [Planctomycetota bacterium]
MRNSKIINKCRHIRDGMQKSILKRIALDKGWLAEHIANCPKCQSRISGLGKVDLALSLIKTQTHKMDLLMRANAQALKMLKHSLRDCPKADKLRVTNPRPNLLMRNHRYISSITSTAACFAILLLLKCGIFSSMEYSQQQGQETVKQYYAKHLDQDTINDIFTA